MKYYINLTNNHKLEVDGECHLLSTYLLTYEEANSTQVVNTVCEEYPYSELAAEEVRRVADYIFDRIWTDLFGELNTYNKVNLGLRFWKYYSSYDFYFFICTYYERFVEIKKAIHKHPGVVFLINGGIDPYYIARTYRRCVIDANYDKVISAIDIQILDYFNADRLVIDDCLVKKSATVARKETRGVVADITKNTIKIVLNELMCRWLRGKVVVCEDVDIKKSEIREFSNAYPRTIYFPYRTSSRAITSPLDRDFRDRIKKRFSFDKRNDFEEVFLGNLYLNLFSAFVEDFKCIWNSNKYFFKIERIHAIIRSSKSEDSMMRAAYVYDQGGIVINLAHSMEDSFAKNRYKTESYSDYLLMWSGKELFTDDKCRHYGNSTLKWIKPVDYKNNYEILYVVSGYNERWIRSEYTAIRREVSSFIDFARIPMDLFFSLDPRYQSEVCFRIREGWGRGQKDFFSKTFQNATIDEAFVQGGKSLVEKIREARIVICETVDTTSFFEALLSRTPVIVVNKNTFEPLFNKQMYDICERLRCLDVIVPDGNSAAKIINDHYERIEEWWNEAERKAAIDDLIQKSRENDAADGNLWLYEIINEITKR